MDYDFTNSNGIAKAKLDIKADMTKKLLEFFKKEYGEDNVAMIRTGAGTTSRVNTIGVVVGNATYNGETNPIVVTINPAVKEFVTRQTAKTSYTPFDFISAKADFISYQEEKLERKAEREAKEIAKAGSESPSMDF